MNREIKFRAWDTRETLTLEYMEWCKERKLYLGGDANVIIAQQIQFEKETGLKYISEGGTMVYDICISDKGKMMEIEGGWDYFGDDDNAIIMQYTGLKDKNGKEIYEGDILNNEGYRWELIVLNDFSDLLSFYYDKVECCLSDDLEIIGNIFENPELLEKTK